VKFIEHVGESRPVTSWHYHLSSSVTVPLNFRLSQCCKRYITVIHYKHLQHLSVCLDSNNNIIGLLIGRPVLAGETLTKSSAVAEMAAQCCRIRIFANGVYFSLTQTFSVTSTNITTSHRPYWLAESRFFGLHFCCKHVGLILTTVT